jgi:hypothetical protein
VQFRHDYLWKRQIFQYVRGAGKSALNSTEFCHSVYLCVKLANASCEATDLRLEQLYNKIISLERGNEIMDNKRKKSDKESDNSKFLFWKQADST